MRRRRRPRRHNTRRAVEIFVTRLTGRPTETRRGINIRRGRPPVRGLGLSPQRRGRGPARDRRRDGPGLGGTCGWRRPVDSGAMRDL